MERDNKVIEMYNSGVSAIAIATELELGRKTIYRILKKHNIILNKDKLKNCLICNKNSFKNLCGTCNTNLRRYRVKKKSVDYLGGECERCGWKGHLAGFDFHHKDPNEKDFGPSARELANKSWSLVKNELDKCELLCAICHREEHSIYNLLEEISITYNGNMLE